MGIEFRGMDKSTLICNAAVVDVDAGTVKSGQTILVLNGCIESISPSAGRLPEHAIDANGAYVSPGLIDAHVHLFLDAGESPRTAFLAQDDDAKLRTAAANAARAIAAGITTVRDCGGPGDLLFRFERSVRLGHVPGPRILAAGSPLTRPKGHCHFFGIEVEEPALARRAVETQLREGASFIKLIASGGGLTPGTRPWEADLPFEIMREAVAAAHANGALVAAHCHAHESIVRALDAKVDVIEHASFVQPDGAPRFDREIAVRMRSEGTVVSPTVISGLRIAETIRERGPQNRTDRDAIARLEARRKHAAKFCEEGVRIIAGTDCGVANTPFDSLIDELVEYVNAGMTPTAALRNATSESARFLGQPRLGQVRQGFAADMTFLAGNPLADPANLRKPRMVMKGGEIVYREAPAASP